MNTVRDEKGFSYVYVLRSKDEGDAFDRERYLKTGMGKRYLKNRLKGFLSLTV